jgi:hypothetical protein
MQLIAAAGWMYRAFIILPFTKTLTDVVQKHVGQGIEKLRLNAQPPAEPVPMKPSSVRQNSKKIKQIDKKTAPKISRSSTVDLVNHFDFFCSIVKI